MGVVEQLTLIINANTKTAIANLRTYDRQTGQTSLATTKLQTVFGKAQSVFAKMRDVMQGPIAALKQIGQVIMQGFQAYDGLVMRAAEAEKAMSSLSAVLASTGGVAGMSFEALKQLGAGITATTLFDPAQVIQAEAVLLTFKEIGQSAFPTAMRAAADMATVMDQDLKTTIVQVGKALNDPIKGVTALRKVGVQLTEAQIEQVKGFMAVNDIASAQAVILGELQSEFGGAAKAAADTATGMYRNMKKAADEAKESWGKFLAFIGKDTSNVFKDVFNQMASDVEAGTIVLNSEKIVKNYMKNRKVSAIQVKAEIEAAGGSLADVIYAAEQARSSKKSDIEFLQYAGGSEAQIAKERAAIESQVSAYTALIAVLKDKERFDKRSAEYNSKEKERDEKATANQEAAAKRLLALRNLALRDSMYEAAVAKEYAALGLETADAWGTFFDESIDGWKKYYLAASEGNVGGVREELDKLTESFEKQKALMDEIGGIFETTFKSAFLAIGQALVEGEEGWKAFARAGIDGVAAIVEALGMKLAVMAVDFAIALDLPRAIAAGIGAAAALTAAGAIRAIPLAEGGIVPARPGGTLALLGEGGRDEAVIPLGRGGGAGLVQNFNFAGSLWATSQLKALGAMGARRAGRRF